MYEIRIKLPYLDDTNPNIERMKAQLIRQVEEQGTIPSYCVSRLPGMVSLVKLDATPATAGKHETKK